MDRCVATKIGKKKDKQDLQSKKTQLKIRRIKPMILGT